MENNNTLIVFASKHGNAEKCARELFHLLEGKVDFCNLNHRKTYPDITTYDTVIVGGSIYHGKVQESVSSFCYKNLHELQQKRLGLFISCIYTGDKAQKELHESFPKPLMQNAIVSDYFGGGVVTSKLSFLEKIIINQLIDLDEVFSNMSSEKIQHFAEKMNTADVIQG